jgi:hypothetical protein
MFDVFLALRPVTFRWRTRSISVAGGLSRNVPFAPSRMTGVPFAASSARLIRRSQEFQATREDRDVSRSSADRGETDDVPPSIVAVGGVRSSAIRIEFSDSLAGGA